MQQTSKVVQVQIQRVLVVALRAHGAAPWLSTATAASTTESTSAAAAPTLECYKPRAAIRGARILGRPAIIPETASVRAPALDCVALPVIGPRD